MSRPPSLTAVIPARMGSSRFPGKPLVPILGLSMIEHVRRRALLAEGVHSVVVATCDAAIDDEVRRFGGQAIMTADTHERCTDRVEEAMRSLTGDITIIVQGDEPLLIPSALTEVARPLVEDEALLVTNLLSPLEGEDDLANPNIVKAVCSGSGEIMFLSRAAIPYFRKQVSCPVYRQTGIMAFRTAFLHRYAKLAETPFERAESIDMLRILEHGYAIRGVTTDYSTVGVDRSSDVPRVEQILREDSRQRAIYERIVQQPQQAGARR